MSYEYKTSPFAHQRTDFETHCADRAWGRWWEQGTGKTKPTIDEAAYLYETGKIDGVLVIAPNGVHRNWVSDEIPIHMPDRVLQHTRCHIWYSTNTKQHRESFHKTLTYPGLAILVMSYNAIWTNRGRDAWKIFLQKRRCLYVLDECHRIKNPAAKWSRRIIGSNVSAPYLRALSGTPIANSPFDAYNILKFLDPNVWKRKYGITTFAAFKQYFGIWQTWSTRDGQNYPKCIAYRNLDLLQQEMARLGSRVIKDEVLDLPPKLYSKRYYDLTADQRRIYRELQDECTAELASGNLTAMLAIVRLIRFQQLVCGYLPSDDCPALHDLPGPNPRIALLGEICEDLDCKTIIWARFRRDIDLICQLLGNACVFVDGRVTGEARGAALDAFQHGAKQFLVANPAAIATGVTLHAARVVIYYSNSFSYELRSQSEDRAHRIGQFHPVNYIDIIANDVPIDTKIVTALRNKLDVASVITGDTLRDWI